MLPGNDDALPKQDLNTASERRSVEPAVDDFGICYMQQVQIVMKSGSRYYTGAVVAEMAAIDLDIRSSGYQYPVFCEVLYGQMLEEDMLDLTSFLRTQYRFLRGWERSCTSECMHFFLTSLRKDVFSVVIRKPAWRLPVKTGVRLSMKGASDQRKYVFGEVRFNYCYPSFLYFSAKNPAIPRKTSVGTEIFVFN